MLDMQQRLSNSNSEEVGPGFRGKALMYLSSKNYAALTHNKALIFPIFLFDAFLKRGPPCAQCCKRKRAIVKIRIATVINFVDDVAILWSDMLFSFRDRFLFERNILQE